MGDAIDNNYAYSRFTPDKRLNMQVQYITYLYIFKHCLYFACPYCRAFI